MIDTELPTAPSTSPVARGFAACLASVLEVPVADLPLPAGGLPQALGAWRSWLAGRGFGLVPIVDPTGFQWAGWWLAVVQTSDTELATVAFGTPPGIVLSPQDPALLGRATAELPITVAYAVASLDPVLRPATVAPDLHGTVEALAIARAAEAPMQVLEIAFARAGRGLDGDRYADGAGTFSSRGGRRPGYDLTLIAAEVLDEPAAAGHAVDFRRHAAQRSDPWHRRQRPRGPPLPHRRRALRRAALVRTVRPPRPAQRPRPAPSAHPQGRTARRHPHRWRSPAGNAHPAGVERLFSERLRV